MTDNVFSNQEQNQTPQNNQQETPATPSNPFADQLSAIKNENGEPKYKTVEDALSALTHSQKHISTLESEREADRRKLQELENELNTRRSVEQVVQDLTTPQSQNQTPNADQQVVDQGLNEDKVKQLFNDLLSQTQQQTVREQNVGSVIKTLSETYGDKTREAVVNRAKELNMRPSDLEQLAGDNPQLVLSLFQGVEVKSTTPVQTSTVSTPRNSGAPLELPKQEQKIISGGATQEEVMNSWNAAKDYTYKKLGVET